MKNIHVAILTIILSGFVEDSLIAMNNNKNQQESFVDKYDRERREREVKEAQKRQKQIQEEKKQREQVYNNIRAIDKMSDEQTIEYNQQLMAKITLCKASCTDAPGNLSNALHHLETINKLLNVKKYGPLNEKETQDLHFYQIAVKENEPNIQVILTTQLQKEGLKREAAQVKQQADREALQLQREKDAYKNEQDALNLQRRQQELAIKEREVALRLAEKQAKSEIRPPDNQTIYTATADIIPHEQNNSTHNGCRCTIS